MYDWFNKYITLFNIVIRTKVKYNVIILINNIYIEKYIITIRKKNLLL